MSDTNNYPTWHFIKVANQGSRSVAPAEGIHFEKLPPLGAVIRESAQNSLDAQDGDGPVHMRISVHTGNQAMPRSIANKYLDGLFRHLDAANELPLISDNADMSYVVVEDFGTHGLVGDPKVFGSEGPEENRFFWFHRNTNRTQARKNRGGSFGYGKASFALASKVHSFFTVSRASDDSIKVFGNSIAKVHQIDGWDYEPYGDFGFEEIHPEKGIGIIPCQEEKFFEQICNDFNLSRGDKNGLSVIIPFPEKGYSSEEIVESMIRNYFLPICQGILTVEIVGNHSIMINSDTIEEVTTRMNWSGDIAGAMTKTTRQCMIGMVELATWWSQGQEVVELETLGETQPFWNRSLIAEEEYGTMRERLEEGQSLAIRASLPIIKKTENGGTERYPENSDFIILLRKQDAYGGSDAVWIRRYLSVPKKDFTPNKSGFIAIMISAEGPLEQLLRESEEVAHTEHRITRIEKNYKYGGDVVRFFRKSAAFLIEYLQETKNVLDTDWLDTWFPSEEIEQDETKKPKKKRKKRKKKEDTEKDDDDIVVGPTPPPEDLIGHDSEIQKITGGFSIFGEIPYEFDLFWRVKLAYVRDDNRDKLKAWKSFDFDLSKGVIEFVLDGVAIEKAEGNTLEFKVEGPIDEYSIDVTGFDNKRDLHVYGRPIMVRKEEIE